MKMTYDVDEINLIKNLDDDQVFVELDMSGVDDTINMDDAILEIVAILEAKVSVDNVIIQRRGKVTTWKKIEE